MICRQPRIKHTLVRVTEQRVGLAHKRREEGEHVNRLLIVDRRQQPLEQQGLHGRHVGINGYQLVISQPFFFKKTVC
jgi:hypothetical protein